MLNTLTYIAITIGPDKLMNTCENLDERHDVRAVGRIRLQLLSTMVLKTSRISYKEIYY